MPRAPMPPPPASQMPLMSRFGAGPAELADAAWPCAPPGLFHGRFYANPTVAPSATAHAPTNSTRFIYTSEIKLGADAQQPAAENLDRILPARTVGRVHVDPPTLYIPCAAVTAERTPSITEGLAQQATGKGTDADTARTRAKSRG